MKRICLFLLLFSAVSFSQISTSTARRIRHGTALPAHCSPLTGDVFFKQSGGGEGLYACTAVDTWTAASGVAGPIGPMGPDGHGVVTGTGAPGASDGTDGDYWFDTVAHVLYGPKAAGAWPSPGTSLVGPTGATGATGPAGASQGVDPVTEYLVRDDFHRAGAAATPATGDLGWCTTSIGGAASTTSSQVVAGHPGIVRFTNGSGGSAGYGGQLLLNMSTSACSAFTGTFNNLGNGMAPTSWEAHFVFALTTSVANVIDRVGFCGSFAINPDNFIGVRVDKTTATPDTYWQFETRSGGTPTANAGDTNLTPAANSWMHLKITSPGSGTIVFTMTDLTGVATSTYTNSNSNVPTAALSPCAIVSNVNTTGNKSIDMDYFGMKELGLAR